MTKPAAIRSPVINPRLIRYAFSGKALGISYLAEMAMSFERRSRRHDHTEIQLLVVIEGGAVIEVEGARIELAPDTMLAIGAGVPHTTTGARGCPSVRLLDLHISSDPPNPLHDEVCAMLGKAQRLIAGTAMATADRLHEAVSGTTIRQRAGVLAAIWDMLASTERPAERAPRVSGPVDVRLQLCDLLMRDHFDGPVDLDDLAAHVHLSRSQLTRLYRKQLGVTPASRLSQVRLDAAEGMLRSSTLTVKQIGSRCGFGSTNSFIRLFKESRGMSPGKYRRML